MVFKTFLSISIIFLSTLITGCNSGGSSTEEGVSVTFSATHHQSPDATLQIPQVPAGTRTFRNSEGIPITLTKAYLVIWSVKLESDCTTTLFTQLNQLLFNKLLPTAQAHTETTPTQLGVPHVINLLDADFTTIELGTVNPPPGDYCGTTVELLKADDDTQKLPSDIDMVNRVLYLEGSYIPLDSTNSVEFKVDTAKTPLPRHLRSTPPLTLSSSQRHAHLTIGIRYDRWFDALNMAFLDDEEQQILLLNNIVASLQMESTTAN